MQNCFVGQQTVLQEAKVLVNDLGLYLDVLTGLFFTSTAADICGEVRFFGQLYAKLRNRQEDENV